MKIVFWRLPYSIITSCCLLGLTAASPASDQSSDVELRIGIVQRFGSKLVQQLQVEPTKGDRLKLTFNQGNQKQTVVTAKPIKLETVMQPLPKPKIEEWVVLGNYRTFETAEHSAKKWRSQGIEVEIAQPERWQVWAKRATYNTPLLRRLLLQTVHAGGTKTAKIETQVRRAEPLVSWVVDDKRYAVTNAEISSDKNLIKINRTKNPEKNPDRTRVYPGRIEIQPNAYGTYSFVNEVPLETYLRGVVPYEIGADAPRAALEAQTIIARTYVLRNLRRFEVDGYQLCADTHCQVYFGITGATPTTDEAIASTRGAVLKHNNELVDALYSASTGGVTAAFSDVWNGEDRPYLRPIIDTSKDIWSLSGKSLASEDTFRRFINLRDGFNETQWDKLFRWRKESSLEDITKDLQKFLKTKNSPLANFKTVQDMSVVKRSHSGRILKFAVKTELGTFYLNKDEVRSAFAAPISTLFYIETVTKEDQPGVWGYAFVGGGMGHGVGLSQTGAQHLANLGWSSSDILRFYYPNTRLQAFNPDRKN